MGNINVRIGGNIRAYRKIRGLTMKELSDRLYALGCDVTPQMIGFWERGDRSATAEQIYYIAKALECTSSSIIDVDDSDNVSSDQMLKQVQTDISCLSEHHIRILYYLVRNWTGDTRALIDHCAMYAALDRRARLDSEGYAIWKYEQELASGRIDRGSPVPDMEYVLKAWNLLHKG